MFIRMYMYITEFYLDFIFYVVSSPIPDECSPMLCILYPY